MPERDWGFNSLGRYQLIGLWLNGKGGEFKPRDISRFESEEADHSYGDLHQYGSIRSLSTVRCNVYTSGETPGLPPIILAGELVGAQSSPKRPAVGSTPTSGATWWL